MLNAIMFLICGALSFFGTRSLARQARKNKEKSDWSLEKACWIASKMVGILVICGFLAATFCTGYMASTVFFSSLGLCIPAYYVGNR